jgi:hypothetical protein
MHYDRFHHLAPLIISIGSKRWSAAGDVLQTIAQ